MLITLSERKETIKRYIRYIPTTVTSIAETAILVVGLIVYLPIIIVVTIIVFPFCIIKELKNKQ